MTIDYRRFSCYDTEYTEAEGCFRTFSPNKAYALQQQTWRKSMKTMKKLLAAMLAIAMLLTCAAFNPLTATAEGAATDSSETTRYCGNDDYPAKSLGGNYSGMPLNIGKKSDDSTKAASRGGQTILAYARNKYTSDGS